MSRRQSSVKLSHPSPASEDYDLSILLTEVHRVTQSLSDPEPSSRTFKPASQKSLSPKKTLHWSALSELNDNWFYESAAVTFSMVCLFTIGLLLSKWSSGPVPLFSSGITQNAIISILATTSKSSMLFVVSSCLSQGKWTWYRNRRSLTHLQLFEDASRGPLGALNLLTSRAAMSTSTIGAVVTLLALAFDPFVQQVLAYPSMPVGEFSNASTVKKAAGFLGEVGFPHSSTIDRAIKTAVLTDVPEQVPSCTSANCTWNPIKSIGVCQKCEDVTIKARTNCSMSLTKMELDDHGSDFNRACELTFDGLPGAYQFDIEFQIWTDDNTGRWAVQTIVPNFLVWDPTSIYGSSWVRESIYADQNNPLVTLIGSRGFTYDERTGSVQFESSQICVIDLCVREYEVSVRNNVPHVVLLSSNYGTKFTQEVTDSTEFMLNCWSEDPNHQFTWTTREVFPNVTPAPQKNVYFDEANHAFCEVTPANYTWLQTAIKVWAWDLTNYLCLAQNVSGISADCYGEEPCLVAPSNTTNDSHKSGVTIPSEMGDILPELYEFMLEHGLNATMQRLADSFTKLALNDSWITVPGKAVTTVVRVQVRWYWLILPALLNVATLSLLLLTVYSSRRHQTPLWKSSITVLLVHGLENGTEVPRSSKLSHIDDLAGSMQVKLKASDEDGRLVFGD